MKNLACLFAFLFLSGCIGSGNISYLQENKKGYFPNLSGMTLMGQPKNLPHDFKNKYIAAIVLFKKDQFAKALDFKQRLDKHLPNPSMTSYIIAILEEANPLSRIWITHSIRYQIYGMKDRNKSILIYTNQEKFLQIMNMKQNNIYLVLLNKQHKILSVSIANEIDALSHLKEEDFQG